MRALPSRIWIVGPCGGGKSTLAARLGRHLGVPATHLDDIHWNPGWVESTPEAEARRVGEVVAGPRWVVDGNYGRLRRPHLDRVDLFVWLDLPLHVTFPRLLRRTFRRRATRAVVCNGNRESLREAFLTRRSLLLWSLTTDRRRRAELTAELAARPHVRLRTPTQVARWVRRVTAAPSPGRS